MAKMQYKTGSLDIKAVREELDLSQSEFADLLGVSHRTIQSCEQEWRKPSASLERATLLLLMAHRNGKSFGKTVCWKETDCLRERRDNCMAYLARQGHLCWLLTGTLCQGIRLRNWPDKLALCLKCDFFHQLLNGEIPMVPHRK